MIAVTCHVCKGKGEIRRLLRNERRPFTLGFDCRWCRRTGRLPMEFRYQYSLTIEPGEARLIEYPADDTLQRCASGPTDYDGIKDVPVSDTAITISGYFDGYELMSPAELRVAIAEELQAAAVESAVGFSG